MIGKIFLERVDIKDGFLTNGAKNVYECRTRDGNGAGFFGYPPHPAPNGMGLKFIKRVWDGYGIFF